MRNGRARKDILRWITHGPHGDIERLPNAPWNALCEEVAKLRITLRDGRLIQLPKAVNARQRVNPKRFPSHGLGPTRSMSPTGFEPYFGTKLNMRQRTPFADSLCRTGIWGERVCLR